MKVAPQRFSVHHERSYVKNQGATVEDKPEPPAPMEDAEETDVMARASWHTFQVLTKRSERLRELLGGPLKEFSKLRWIQWGVSVEDKKYGLPRISHLQAAPAAVRILSVEPLLEDLGKINLKKI